MNKCALMIACASVVAIAAACGDRGNRRGDGGFVDAPVGDRGTNVPDATSEGGPGDRVVPPTDIPSATCDTLFDATPCGNCMTTSCCPVAQDCGADYECASMYQCVAGCLTDGYYYYLSECEEYCGMMYSVATGRLYYPLSQCASTYCYSTSTCDWN